MRYTSRLLVQYCPLLLVQYMGLLLVQYPGITFRSGITFRPKYHIFLDCRVTFRPLPGYF